MKTASKPRRPPRQGEPEKSCVSSANLFAVGCGPPWAGINGGAVLTELYIENRLARAYRDRCGRFRPSAHQRHRFAGQHELANIHRNPFHAREKHMIASAGIEDQELSVGTEWSGIGDPAVAGRRNLGAGPGRDRHALFASAEAVGHTEVAKPDAVHRKRQRAFGCREGDRRPETGLTGGKFLAAIRRGRLFGVRTHGRGGTGGGVLLELGNELLDV